MPELIGGHQFAIPNVNSLKTSDWTNALGGIGFGFRGEEYRVLFLNESSTVTIPAGQLVFLETATGALTAAGQTATAFNPWIVQTASVTNLGAGIMVLSARGQGLAIVQVGGPATVTLSNSGEASAQSCIFVPNGTGVWLSANESTSVVSGSTDTVAVVPIVGMFGRMLPGYSSAQSTVLINIRPAQNFMF